MYSARVAVGGYRWGLESAVRFAMFNSLPNSSAHVNHPQHEHPSGSGE